MRMYYVTILFITGFLFLSSSVQAQVPQTWYVPADFNQIQAAIAADGVNSGDTIVVSSGTYSAINYSGKNLHIKHLDVGTATIDGNNTTSAVTISLGENSGAILEGFTITNGNASNGGGIYIYNSSPKIYGCTITDNSATLGGGICCLATTTITPEIDNNDITDNDATRGGGIYCGANVDATITDNTISSHALSGATYGGGIYCTDSSPEIDGNTIVENEASHGGGICCEEGGDPQITNNYIGTDSDGNISGNIAQYGGGIYAYDSKPAIGLRYNGNTIMNNEAITTGLGGGIYLADCGSSVNSELVINDNTIEDNEANHCGGGIYIYCGYIRILFNSILDNHTDGDSATEGGGGIYFYDPETVAIKWNQIDENQDQDRGCGGGVHCYVYTGNTATIVVDSNTFRDNQVNRAGGGLYYDTDAFSGATPAAQIWNGLFEANQALTSSANGGAGVYVLSGNPDIYNCTVEANTVPQITVTRMAGILCAAGTTPVVSSSIIYNNTFGAGATAGEIGGAGSPTVYNCCISTGWGGAGSGNFTTAPTYVNTTWYKLQTGANSCVDTGNLTWFATKDFENETRPKNGGIGLIADVGWDER